MTKKELNVLLIEDDPDDVLLIKTMVSELRNRHSANSVIRVIPFETIQQGIDYLKSNRVDTLLLDLSLPDSQGFDTIQRIFEHEKDTPIIILTGISDDQIAERALQYGVQDYLVKGQINSFLLERSIKYAIERFNNLREKEKLITELKEALTKINTLSGLLPMCSNCKKIRNDNGYWEQVEAYIEKHSHAEFSHGICPECIKILYPDLLERPKRKKKNVSEGD
ncbi:MAG: response regulator [Candidatus Omnitrophota bacterium]